MDAAVSDRRRLSEHIEKRLSVLLSHCKALSERKGEGEFAPIGEYLRRVSELDAEYASDNIPFLRLCHDFSLSEFEREVIFLALAPVVDFRFREAAIAINGNYAHSQPGCAMALLLFSESFGKRIENRAYFLPGGHLIAQRLLEMQPRAVLAGEADYVITLPARVKSYVLGEKFEETNGFSRLLYPKTSWDEVILPAEHSNRLRVLAENYDTFLKLKSEWGYKEPGPGGRNMVLLFCGESGTGKTLTAHALAAHLGRPLLCVDSHALHSERGLGSQLDMMMREARLQRAVLLFDDCELLFASRLSGNADLSLMLSALDAYEGLIILTTNLPMVLDAALERRITLQTDFEILPTKLRERVWRLHLPEKLPLASDVDLKLLAEKYEFSGGTIRNAVSVAVNRALGDASACEENFVVCMRHLEDAAHAQIRNKIKTLAAKSSNHLTIKDLILPRDIMDKIRAIIAAVRNRRTIFDEWGFSEKLTTGRGLCILFRGDSGTGKTLTSEILANELGLALYRVRIPAIVSKYIGETEKNLEKCFREAGTSGSLLLFDEADSIFSKRTDVQNANDRYSNMEVNLLLQEIERFDGIVILTTNLDAGIDDAFERRLNHKIDFPFPEPKDRARIWKHLLPEAAPKSDDIDYAYLGKSFELSGGCIKNAVLRAAYTAAEQKCEISNEILESSAIQEYREMGKLVPNIRNPWD